MAVGSLVLLKILAGRGFWLALTYFLHKISFMAAINSYGIMLPSGSNTQLGRMNLISTSELSLPTSVLVDL